MHRLASVLVFQPFEYDSNTYKPKRFLVSSELKHFEDEYSLVRVYVCVHYVTSSPIIYSHTVQYSCINGNVSLSLSFPLTFSSFSMS